MSWFSGVHLISLYGFYLALMFILSTLLRLREYRIVLGLVTAVPGRWPRLFQLVKQHSHIFLTWGTVLPLLLSLGLIVLNAVANSLIWPRADATLTLAHLLELWPAVPVVAVCGVVMLTLDLLGTFRVGRLDRELLESHFETAEYWLRSWTAPAIRVLSLGYVNPRKIVGVEVRNALIAASELLNATLWWVAVQTGVRFLFGLSLYATYLLSDWLRTLVAGG
jgi:hypothetical protein